LGSSAGFSDLTLDSDLTILVEENEEEPPLDSLWDEEMEEDPPLLEEEELFSTSPVSPLRMLTVNLKRVSVLFFYHAAIPLNVNSYMRPRSKGRR